MGLRKILCPVDFSPSSREAMTVALRLATQHRSELIISFVWRTAPTAASGERLGPDEIVHDLVEQARWGLGELAETMCKLGTSNVTPRIVDDQPWSKIVELANEDPEIDLVVFGTRDRTGLARLLRGSIVELVVRHAPCPVLVVPDEAVQPFARALCAVDLSPQSELEVELAVEVMQAPAQITLLHVIESPSFYGEAFVPVGLDPSFATPAEDALDRWRATLPIPTVSELRVGRADAEILMAAESRTFDLVVVATHSRDGLRRMFLGSVAEAVVRHSHRPVLVARPQRRTTRLPAVRERVLAEASMLP